MKAQVRCRLTVEFIRYRISSWSSVSDKNARRHAISEWFMEFSVLWAVFPLLDRLVEGREVEPLVIVVSLATSLTAGAIGLILR